MESTSARSRRRVAIAVGVILVLVPFFLRTGGPNGLMRDFGAFYCAGAVLAAGGDPYRAEPLGACERRPKAALFRPGLPGLVTPAPLPPYALAPFVLLSRLPFAAASGVWWAVVLGAVAVTVAAMRRLTRLPLALLIAAVALTDGYVSLCLGQVAPLAVAAISLAAALVSGGRERAAAAVLSVAMIEPHVGLPACLALFSWRPRTRPVFAVAGLCAVALSLALAGSPTTIEYLREVLPAHALSEVANPKQFSLTYLLVRLGAGPAEALRAGEIWYVVLVAAGVLAGGLAAKRGRGAAAIVVIPPALALLGGPFVHIAQIAAALPAALLLYSQARGATRIYLGIALGLLALPFVQFADLGTSFIVLAALVALVLALTCAPGRPLVAAIAVAGVVSFWSLLISLVVPAPHPSASMLAQYDPHALAEQGWSLYVRTVGSANERAFDVAKFPTIVGLLGVALACASAALRSLKVGMPDEAIAYDGNGADASRRIAFH
jgi:hypothetical protein